MGSFYSRLAMDMYIQYGYVQYGIKDTELVWLDIPFLPIYHRVMFIYIYIIQSIVPRTERSKYKVR